VLIGLERPDDAGAYRLGPDLAIVQTVDFFTPIVDDPYDFGRIAAVNALSDVYAMGARPITALNLAAFPAGDDPGPAVLARILQGGLDVLTDAGVALLGGHTIDDPEPKYGLAVTGIAHPERIRTKGGARAGDRLLLTKPIGIGAATTALKQGRLTAAEIAALTALMLRRNDQLESVQSDGVHAVTDVTGFGLLGHLLEMVRASGVGARIKADRVPVVAMAPALVRSGVVPGGSRKNLAFVRPHLRPAAGVDDADLQLLADAVTSGGLLLAVQSEAVSAVAEGLKAEGAVLVAEIGEITATAAGPEIAIDP
jgi:selenide, water dikinase